MTNFIESVVEDATLEWFAELGYEVLYGPDIAHDGLAPERESYHAAILTHKLRDALRRLNPSVSDDALTEAYRRVSQASSASLMQANRAFHLLLTDGLEIEVLQGGETRGERVQLIDFANPERNTWTAINQFTMVQGQIERRPDVVVFVNGLPLAVIELKNAADEQATVWKAWQQLQTYQQQIPELFTYNAVQVVSDGLEARLGTLYTPRERFLPWKTVDGQEVASAAENALEVLLKGVFDKRRFLELVRHFIVFEADGAKVDKKIAAYHQFHAVQKAVQTTLEAKAAGTGKGGVIWHTQGSGKSLTMVFFAGKLILHPAMQTPTLVVLTDRIDLDGQLHGVFARCKDLLRQTPVQAESRSDLQEKLRVASGGVVFTTMQKFLPEEKGMSYASLSERRNIIVIVDEAHRGQYDFLDGFARHIRDALPNATFVGFTGTPLELEDRDTRLVFGDYIDIYDVQRAVEDGATVPIYYESRLAKLELSEDERPRLDAGFEEVTEGEEIAKKERLKTKWAQLESLVGNQKRLAQLAEDLIAHFDGRRSAMEGKAMVVCMSRRICVELYQEIIRLRPEWHTEDDETGVVKIVMTGSATDPTEWQGHIRSKARRGRLADRFKEADDPFKLVIVRDMWLTGFDVPALHTMYVDKPMKGHSLMQAIARVNRVFKDKPGGLVVDYLGLATSLKEALASYVESGGKGKAALNQDEAVAVMLEKLDVCQSLFHGFDYTPFITGGPAQRLRVLPAAQEHILALERGEKGHLQRFLRESLALSKAFALTAPHDAAIAAREEIIFFQTVRAALNKTTSPTPQSIEDRGHAIRQLVERAIAPEGVVDIFAAAGLDKPDISILSDGFLAEVRDMPQRNLAVELLEKLLQDDLKVRSRRNLVQSRAFSEKLEASLRKYHNRSVETAQVIAELIELAREVRAAQDRGDNLGLSDDEVAFYDALEASGDVSKLLGNETLRTIAREVAETVRRNATVDWTVRESVRANMRRMVKRVLKRHGYPPEQQEQATLIIVRQAELFTEIRAA